MDLFIGVFALLSGVLVSGQDVVNTTSGLVRGQWLPPLRVIQFLGIPYAEAPKGDLRFKPPVRKTRMEGIFNATKNTLVCPQPDVVEGPASIRMTEDCLRLDIYVPRVQSVARGNDSFPVMIWIHGGGYMVGSSNNFIGYAMANIGQVIVVAINYRLGIFGFLNTMDENAVGNFGLRDQCSAIEWVADNIGAFGGDVSRVTLFGQSAGASSVMQLAMSSLCKGKFHRIIAQSGTPESSWAYNKDPKKSSLKLAEKSECPSSSAGLVECLKTKTMAQLSEFPTDTISFVENDWVPTYKNKDIFPDNPLDILSGEDSGSLRRFLSVDFMSGVCNEEGEFVFSWEVSHNSVSNPTINKTDAVLTDDSFKSKLRRVVSAYQGLDPNEMNMLYPAFEFHYREWQRQPDEFSNVRSLIRLHSDVSFNLGQVAYSNVHSSGMAATNRSAELGGSYFYQLKPKPSFLQSFPWSQGATHVSDIYFVFGLMESLNGTPAEIQLSARIIQYWTNFAKTGSPNEPELTMAQPQWPMYNTKTEEYLKLELDLDNDSISAFPYARRVAFWKKFYKPELQRIRRNKEKVKAEQDKCTDKRRGDGTNSASVNSVFGFWKIIPAILILLKLL